MRVFVSYSRHDIEAANTVADVLRARDVDVFIDYQRLTAMDNFPERLAREIDSRDVLILLLSEDSAVSKWVVREVQYADHRSKPIVVMRLDAVSLPHALFFLAYQDYIDCTGLRTDGALSQNALKKLCRSLDISLEPPSTSSISKSSNDSLNRIMPDESIDLLPPIASSSAPILSTLPEPFVWCPIPSGKVTIADTTYEVPAFEMAKYPITNAQYQVFVTANDGYGDPKWWNFSATAKAWRRRNAQPWPPAFEGDDHPRANVSWYEAIAFCRWLAARLSVKPGQPTISLPNETQWQWAAMGETRRKYPWGNSWNLSRCNTSIGAYSEGTESVQKFEGRGDSPFGVSDMVGNVIEWCVNAHADNPNSVDLQGDFGRAIRGCSWKTTEIKDLYVWTRRAKYPWALTETIGFRIVRTY